MQISTINIINETGLQTLSRKKKKKKKKRKKKKKGLRESQRELILTYLYIYKTKKDIVIKFNTTRGNLSLT
ncbi:hypothetical protein RchiOBHm_Chr4g0431501 [Rosa chinensis]|uniref:Uncharacterized protein n=1 Tax=Rosa chinensis TaxID=74649 RepID=A0A2P6R0P9_ROSCH|nr:hypothetical protein RchiOBHm_Chr4g0431501 [Rosa chinensis]